MNSDALDRECGNYHEIDLEGIFRPVTQWCGTVRRLDDIPGFLGRAFQAMTWGRPRPGRALSSPGPDAGGLRDAIETPAFPRSTRTGRTGRGDRAGRGNSGRAERPIILAGGGALWSGAAAEIEALAARLGAPVITTLNGKGLLDERHPLSLGHARSAGAGMSCRTPTSCSPSAAGLPRS